MSNYTQIHETVIRDIVDLISDAKEATKDLDNALPFDSQRSKRSIARATSDLVLVFPFMCDSTVSIATAGMITKAIERQASSMLQMLFASCALVTGDERDTIKSGEDFLKKFHTNINMGKMTIDDFISTMNSITMESTEIKVTDGPMYEAVMKDLQGLTYHLPESLTENTLSDYSIINRNDRMMIVKEDKKEGLQDPVQLAKFYKDMADFQKTRLLDTDVKKANELAPTMMVVNFQYENMDKAMSFVCGVKCRLIPVDPYDIANHIMTKHNDNNVLLNFIKATTKEISFFKDFLFAIDRAKVDAIAQSKRGSSNPMWKVLERRAVKSRWKRAMSRQNDATMITTLGMSKEVTEYIKKQNGIDASNPRVMESIMEGYNLMGTVIIDEASEVAQFMWDDGRGSYESISFNNLEREGNGGEYKKAINLVSKMYR